MDWTGSNGCQNCIALNKKLELFELLKQKCCKTDDITKNFLALKTSYEKSAKLLENKSKKLSEVRNKLKDASKGEELSKRKAAEFQLRLVSSDNIVQDLRKDLDSEREKNAILLQEKLRLEILVEVKDNEITSLNILSKQCEEKFAEEVNNLNLKNEKKIDVLKSDIQKLQEVNSKLKTQGNQKKRHDKLREDIVDIFKDGVILVGEPLKRFKRLLTRLRENENAAKLEAMLDTPSMTPDGTTSTDTGVFSGDEDFGCPSLGNDLEISSDSDDDFENVPTNVAWSASSGLNQAPFKLAKVNSSPLEERFPTMELDTNLMQDTCGVSVSNESVNDGDATLCAITNDSSTDDINMSSKSSDVSKSSESKKSFDAQKSVETSENLVSSSKALSLLNIDDCDLNVTSGMGLTSPLSSPPRKLSPNGTLEKSPVTTKKTDGNYTSAGETNSLFSPPGGDFDPSMKSLEKSDICDISFDVVHTEKRPIDHEILSSKSDASSASGILAKELDSKLEDSSVPSSTNDIITTASSPLMLSNACIENSEKVISEKNEDSDLLELGSDIQMIPPAGPVSECLHNSTETKGNNSDTLKMKQIGGNSTTLESYRKGYSTFVKGETFTSSGEAKSTENSTSSSKLSSAPEKASQIIPAVIHQPVVVSNLKEKLKQSNVPSALESCRDSKETEQNSSGTPSDQNRMGEAYDCSSVPIKSKSCLGNVQDLSDNCVSGIKPQEDEMDLDSMLNEWNPPTPILPFSDDSCGFDGALNNSLQDLPKKVPSVASIGTNTDSKQYKSTASSPISPLIMKHKSTSTDKGFKQEKILKDAFCSPPRSVSCNRATSPMKVSTKSSASSPLRSLYKNVSLSPIRMPKLDSVLNPSDCDIIITSDTESKDEPWSREAKMLQQTLEVLGISTGDLSGVVLDQSLVEELRMALEMSLRKRSKTGDYSMRNPVPAKQFDTSYCSFDVCEFAEICNQQHYNLHLLAKAKHVEQAICSRPKKKSKRKLKRLQRSSRRQRSSHTLLFKEEVLDDDDSSQRRRRKSKNLSENSQVVNNLTGTNNSYFVDTVGSFNTSSSFLPTNEDEPAKQIEEMNCSQSEVSDENPQPKTIVLPVLNTTEDKQTEGINSSQSSLPAAINPQKNYVDIIISEKKNTTNLGNSVIVTPEVDNYPIERISSDADILRKSVELIPPNEMGAQLRCDLDLSDSDTSDHTLIIDDSIPNSNPTSPEVLDSNDCTKETCKKPVPKKDAIVPETNTFAHPQPIHMSLRKRQPSSSSESGTGEISVPLRRSPRMKKIRIAHSINSVALESDQKGSSSLTNGEKLNSSEGVNSTTEKVPQAIPVVIHQQPVPEKNLEPQPKRRYLPSLPDHIGRSSPISRTNRPGTSLKRSAETEPTNEEFSKRIRTNLSIFKHPPSHESPSVQSDLSAVDKVSTTDVIVENEVHDSDSDMDCNEKQSNIPQNTKDPTVRVSSTRKLSKLQKMRSSVSKAHPLVQGAKSTRSPGAAKEHLNDSGDQRLEGLQTPKQDVSSDPKDSVDEASIIDRLRSRGILRMAAAASGRTAKLIQVKPVKMYQRPAATSSPISDHIPKKPVTRVARNQPLVRPADRVTSLGSNAPTKPIIKSTDSASESPDRLHGECQNSAVQNRRKQKREESPRTTNVSGPKKETYESVLISKQDLRISTCSPLACALTDQNDSQPPTSDRKEIIRTQILVTKTLKEFISAPSFTSSVLQKAVDALSDPDLSNIMPVIVQKIVKMMDDDFDSAPLSLGNKQSFAPPLTPVQQQLVTLICQLSSQHLHLQPLPQQVLRLLEYRVFRLGLTPEGERLQWCAKLHAAICRMYCLRSQALIFCWDSLYTLRRRSYSVVKAVMEVWPHLFPISPTFEKACPNAQVLLHFLRSSVEDKNGGQQTKFDNSWLSRMLRSRALQSLSINSSILATTIFSNIISGVADVNMVALVLLAKREEENWTMRDLVCQRLLPALDRWRNGSLSDMAGEQIIWILCSILRAIPPERNGNTSHTLMKLLTSELLKPENTLTPQMQEVVAIGLALLSRHDIENVAVALASWFPKHGPSQGFSCHLLQYLTSMVSSGSRPVSWWQGIVDQISQVETGVIVS